MSFDFFSYRINEKCILLFHFCLFKGWYNIQVPVILSCICHFKMHKHCCVLPFSNS